MPVAGTSVFFRASAWLALALSASPAVARWLPEWIGIWTYDEPVRRVTPVGLRVAGDGGLFGIADVIHHNRSHATLLHFGSGGDFAWAREFTVDGEAGIALLPGERVALVGQTVGAGSALAVTVRVYDAANGDLIWERQTGPGRIGTGNSNRRHVAVGANGDLLVRAYGGDREVIVFRYDAAGNALAEWRAVVADTDAISGLGEIVALPDGGAAVTSDGTAADGQKGLITVRFDATGRVVFSDIEFGEAGVAQGLTYLVAHADGTVVVAAAPESPFGETQSQVWKLAADGRRLWTRVLPDASPGSNAISALAPAADGDVLVVMADFGSDKSFHLLRLDGASGAVVWNVDPPIGFSPSTLGVAANGRVLVGGFALAGVGRVTSRVVEFDAGGRPCRRSEDLAMFGTVAAAASPDGWTVLGPSENLNDAVVRRYDADGACTESDAVFADGFETVAAGH